MTGHCGCQFLARRGLGAGVRIKNAIEKSTFLSRLDLGRVLCFLPVTGVSNRTVSRLEIWGFWRRAPDGREHGRTAGGFEEPPLRVLTPCIVSCSQSFDPPGAPLELARESQPRA